MKVDYKPQMTKYAPTANDKAVQAIIKHLGIALQGTERDTQSQLQHAWQAVGGHQLGIGTGRVTPQ